MNYIVHGVAKSGTLLSDFHFPFPIVDIKPQNTDTDNSVISKV